MEMSMNYVEQITIRFKFEDRTMWSKKVTPEELTEEGFDELWDLVENGND
jgi:hypothetical protein